MSGSLPVTGLPDGDDIRPPSSEVGVVGWLRHNLFSSLPSSVATILVGGLLLVGLALFADWALADARWGVITSNMRLFLVGLYPPSEIWRVWVLLLVLSLVMGLSAGSWRGGAVRMMAIMVAAGQVAIGLLALVSGLGLAGSLALVADAAILIVAMALARRRRVGNRWLFVLWAVVALLTVPLLGGLGESGIHDRESHPRLHPRRDPGTNAVERLPQRAHTATTARDRGLEFAPGGQRGPQKPRA